MWWNIQQDVLEAHQMLLDAAETFWSTFISSGSTSQSRRPIISQKQDQTLC